MARGRSGCSQRALVIRNTLPGPLPPRPRSSLPLLAFPAPCPQHGPWPRASPLGGELRAVGMRGHRPRAWLRTRPASRNAGRRWQLVPSSARSPVRLDAHARCAPTRHPSLVRDSGQLGFHGFEVFPVWRVDRFSENPSIPGRMESHLTGGEGSLGKSRAQEAPPSRRWPDLRGR